MTRNEFEMVIGSYLADVKEQALVLFDGGVAHERCVHIATQIIDGRDMQRLRAVKTFGASAPSRGMGHGN